MKMEKEKKRTLGSSVRVPSSSLTPLFMGAFWKKETLILSLFCKCGLGFGMHIHDGDGDGD